jgi:hypothetical protein
MSQFFSPPSVICCIMRFAIYIISSIQCRESGHCYSPKFWHQLHLRIASHFLLRWSICLHSSHFDNLRRYIIFPLLHLDWVLREVIISVVDPLNTTENDSNNTNHNISFSYFINRIQISSRQIK